MGSLAKCILIAISVAASLTILTYTGLVIAYFIKPVQGRSFVFFPIKIILATIIASYFIRFECYIF